MSTPFWSNDPTILFHKDYVFELWPLQRMTFESKLNAITRMVILLSILGFLFTSHWNFLFMGIITLFVLFFIYKYRKQKLVHSMLQNKEGFQNDSQTITVNPDTLETLLKSDFYKTNKKNPLGNVLLTEIHDTPNRKAAPPSFNTDVYDDINKSTKKTVQFLNPDIKNTNKQLFGDLGDNYDFDWSMRNFYSMPNTRVTSDQGAFSNYLYGNMPSAKEGNPFALLQDNLRYILI
jgi:hypothetical protein